MAAGHQPSAATLQYTFNRWKAHWKVRSDKIRPEGYDLKHKPCLMLVTTRDLREERSCHMLHHTSRRNHEIRFRRHGKPFPHKVGVLRRVRVVLLASRGVSILQLFHHAGENSCLLCQHVRHIRRVSGSPRLSGLPLVTAWRSRSMDDQFCIWLWNKLFRRSWGKLQDKSPSFQGSRQHRQLKVRSRLFVCSGMRMSARRRVRDRVRGHLERGRARIFFTRRVALRSSHCLFVRLFNTVSRLAFDVYLASASKKP